MSCRYSEYKGTLYHLSVICNETPIRYQCQLFIVPLSWASHFQAGVLSEHRVCAVTCLSTNVDVAPNYLAFA